MNLPLESHNAYEELVNEVCALLNLYGEFLSPSEVNIALYDAMKLHAVNSLPKFNIGNK